AAPRVAAGGGHDAEALAEVDEVVLEVVDARIAAVGDPGVEEVALLDVDVVEPGEDGVRAAQVPAQLVRDAVVAIVVAHALGGMTAERLALDPARGHGADPAVGGRGDLVEAVIELAANQRVLVAPVVADRRLRGELEVAAPELDDEVLGGVVAAGPQ